MEFLERSIYILLQNEPFFAHFILNSNIVYDRFNCQTAGAAIVDGSPVLIFNTKFMGKLTPEGCVAVLKHEILHLLLNHHARGQQTMPNKLMANLAMDCAINQYIEGIPEGGFTLETMKQICKKQVLPFETAEYYYTLLQSESDKYKNEKTVDDHDLVVPGEEGDPMQAKAATEAASSKALDAAKGNVSEKLSKILNNLRTEPKLNWKQILRNFIATHTSNKSLNTRKKSHRRFDLDFPGRKKKRELILGVCCDSSGSVSDASYQMFMNEITGMIGSVSEIHLVHADCEVQKVEKLKSKKDIKFDRHGAGGTAYGPALKECIKLKCNAIVYLGDMDCADIPTNPGVPVLWVTVGSTKAPGAFGKMLELKA